MKSYLVGIIIGVIILMSVMIYFVIQRLKSRSYLSRQTKKSRDKSVSKKMISRQSCSYCKKKVSKITFYSNGHKVVGVCDLCRPQAERQALMRL